MKEVSAEARKAIGGDIKTVQLGWPMGMPLVRKMDDRLWEVRSSIPEGIARVMFTTVKQDMVLLHGFVKKSPTTPKTDLALAKKRRDEVIK
ncbi:type II toxin-antitoxin system RelE/ParE family toxin [Stenotrophomonas maltophilia]|nr:type II toxin-antitoxin system RelE/ParE family toxin [Stenotrophomonas maltophilia]QNG74979.1 type II toxin-antitoxin system RelE/ParE family toxin [Stenotrophomonas maltophilia]